MKARNSKNETATNRLCMFSNERKQENETDTAPNRLCTLMNILHTDPPSFPRLQSRRRLFFPKMMRCFHSKCSIIGGKLKFTHCFSLKVSKLGGKPVFPLFLPKSPTIFLPPPIALSMKNIHQCKVAISWLKSEIKNMKS